MQSEFKISNCISDCVSLYRVAFLYSFNVNYLTSNAKKRKKKDIKSETTSIAMCFGIPL